MLCKFCGGTLSYSEGQYICSNCRNQFAFTDIYENIDAYICYVETDDAGRRTKDSILAQDIYKVLEGSKVKTFCARISADGVAGEELEKACNAAINNAKIVLILATQKQHFEKLMQKYSSLYAGKVIIPVFAEMNAYDIPKGISAIQALDYSKVGAGVDLIKGVCNALGRKQEYDYLTLTSKTTTRKKLMLWIVSVLLLIVATTVGSCCYIKSLNVKPSSETGAGEKNTQQTQEKQYEDAMACIEAEDYVQALTLFAGLPEYKDRDKQVALIYQRYAGYYQNKDGDISLWIQVWEGNACGIEVTKKTPYGVCIISENFQLDGITQTIVFNDSENNFGQVALELGNKEIAVTIETTDVASNIYICDAKVTFLLEEKSDKPVWVQLDAETLRSMARGETTLGQLRRQGFELQFNENEKNTIATEYRLKNTDVVLVFSSMDPNTLDPLDDPVVAAISAPAYMIIPDKIGERNDAFEKDHIIYVPDGEIRGDVGTGLMFGFPEETADEYLAELGKIIKRGTIERNTNVCFTGTNPPASGYDWLYEIYIEGLPII